MTSWPPSAEAAGGWENKCLLLKAFLDEVVEGSARESELCCADKFVGVGVFSDSHVRPRKSKSAGTTEVPRKNRDESVETERTRRADGAGPRRPAASRADARSGAHRSASLRAQSFRMVHAHRRLADGAAAACARNRVRRHSRLVPGGTIHSGATRLRDDGRDGARVRRLLRPVHVRAGAERVRRRDRSTLGHLRCPAGDASDLPRIAAHRARRGAARYVAHPWRDVVDRPVNASDGQGRRAACHLDVAHRSKDGGSPGGASDISREDLQRYVSMVETGKLEIRRGPVWSFEQLQEAHRAMDEDRANGKMVVVVAGA